MKKRKYFPHIWMILVLVFTCIFSTVLVNAASEPTKITLNKKAVSMLPGEKVTLKPTITPSGLKDEKLTWKSSNKAIATVSAAGKVTAKKAGTATITVLTSNNKKATCKITVSAKKPTKIKLNKSALAMVIGDTYTLTSTITPSTAKTDILTWSSSNKAVATVSAGLVTAKKAGTATITVSTSNGKKTTCKITVSSKKPTQITLNKSSETFLPGEKYTLIAKISPSTAKTDILTWSSSNTAVATVSDGTVTMQKAGTATITVKTSNNKSASFKVTVNPVYVDLADYVRIKTPSGSRTFHKYSQYAYGSYLSSHGCVTTAVAMIASSFGQDHSPKEIHSGAETAVYSEKYALKQLTGNSNHGLYERAAISTNLAAQILKDMGIPVKPVYEFTVSKAAEDMKAHLAKGKPVLVKADNRKVNGVQVANGHHALVLIGLDENGMGIFIDPTSKKLNYAHASKTYIKMNLETFVRNHMTSCSGSNYKNPYVTGLSTGNYTGGGYILVG